MFGRAYYADEIDRFLAANPSEVLGALVENSPFTNDLSQINAWREQIAILRSMLPAYCGRGKIYFEFSVPRLGKRIDVLSVIDHVIFVIEFKVGETAFSAAGTDQVCDYALDLKNFHETSHDKTVAPVLVATGATNCAPVIASTPQLDGLLFPIHATVNRLGPLIEQVLAFSGGEKIHADTWEAGRYCPTPTIIEAAIALYGNHSVQDISRNDASAVNLGTTSEAIAEIIRSSKDASEKSICFVTGVPGAGKTLVGLNIATTHINKESELYSVFLSGNGPLVAILREALARDKVRREREAGRQIRKGAALSEVKTFIQNVHHFRDECLIDSTRPPAEHVALFDEAQRAWNLEKTASFMQRRKRITGFSHSEPEFLISCLDRHPDWAVIVCLVGGGQEINTGEAGISEWVEALLRCFPEWKVYISSRLHDSEYDAGRVLERLAGRRNVAIRDELHLNVSMRSFRAENVSLFVKQLLDLDESQARRTLHDIRSQYPIALTRNLKTAKAWLQEKARGSERYGLIVSSQAQRLKPYAIDVKSPVDPVHWFLDGKEDVRSSFYLEDVATEFHVQGLELDWACVNWDADFRHSGSEWRHFSFVGDRWNRINKLERRTYLKNAYRVLLTRARQGMVIVVPEGDGADPTRAKSFYNPTFEYLRRIGLETI